MADSTNTRKTLAAALVNLMQTKPFPKISVAEICASCKMNRKSFYYHFKDKYDLMNWIFDEQLRASIQNTEQQSGWGLMLVIAGCIHDNRKFYANALSVHGQNSLNEHIQELAQPLIYEKLQESMAKDRITDFHVNYFTDALMAAFYRWTQDENGVSPEVFLEMLRECMLISGGEAQKSIANEA